MDIREEQTKRGKHLTKSKLTETGNSQPNGYYPIQSKPASGLANEQKIYPGNPGVRGTGSVRRDKGKPLRSLGALSNGTRRRLRFAAGFQHVHAMGRGHTGD